MGYGRGWRTRPPSGAPVLRIAPTSAPGGAPFTDRVVGLPDLTLLLDHPSREEAPTRVDDLALGAAGSHPPTAFDTSPLRPR